MKRFPLFCICVILLSVVCFGCHKSSKNIDISEDSLDAVIVQRNEAPIHVIYNQRCNGYCVSMDFMKDGEGDNWGSATFTFQKPQNSFSVHCDMFVLPMEAVENVNAAEYLDGYVFYYVPTFDGLNSYYSMTNTVYLYSNNTDIETQQSAVRIEVAEEGLYEIRMINCYQKDGEPQNVEKLLEFDQVIDSLETYLHNEVGSFGGNVPYDISKIKLEYVLVSDENGTAYVPEWVFYTHMQSAVTPNAYIAVGAINAIDGSISLMDAATNMYFMY